MAMNDKEFEAIVTRLQQEVFDETRKAYGDAGFERWRNPRFHGRMDDADSHARITGRCGDTMEIFLKFRDGRVEKASYATDGCGSSALCGSFAAEMAIGCTPDEITIIDGDEILGKIGTFPEEDVHCAALAAETLQEALHRYMLKKGGSKEKGEVPVICRSGSHSHSIT